MEVKRTINSVSLEFNENPFLNGKFQELIYQSYILPKFKEGKTCKYFPTESGLFVKHIAIPIKSEILTYSYFGNKIAKIFETNKARLGSLEDLCVCLEKL